MLLVIAAPGPKALCPTVNSTGTLSCITNSPLSGGLNSHLVPTCTFRVPTNHSNALPTGPYTIIYLSYDCPSPDFLWPREALITFPPQNGSA